MNTPLKQETLNAPVPFSTWREANEILCSAFQNLNANESAAGTGMHHGLKALQQAFPEIAAPTLAAIVVRHMHVARLVSTTPVDPRIAKWVSEEGKMQLPLFYAGAITLFCRAQSSLQTDDQPELDIDDLGINARHLEIWPGRILLEQIVRRELVDKHDLAELRRKEMEWTRAKLDCQRGDLWFWQGDGSDYPDSLSCHVVMSADNLRGLLAKAARGDHLDALINTPEVDDFLEGVRREAPHQVERWGVDHDAGKTPADWFWLVGYLAGKALHSAICGDIEKAKHHTITAAGALANWHRQLVSGHGRMRPGIDGEAALNGVAHD